MSSVPASTTDETSPSGREAELANEGRRKQLGAFYTPPAVVDELLAICLRPLLAERERGGVEAVASLRILDPTCGAGSFLAPALEQLMAALVRCGADPSLVGVMGLQCVIGIDIDPGAIEACRRRLARVAGVAEGTPMHLWEADALVMRRQPTQATANDRRGRDGRDTNWQAILDDADASVGVDLVIGNPPFLGQLRSDTSFDRDYASVIKQRFGALAGAYTDAAALFMVVGLEVVRADRGRLCLIEPLSVLSAKGAAPIRDRLVSAGAMTDAWFPPAQVFPDAAVNVWAPVVEMGSQQGVVAIHGATPSLTARLDDPMLYEDPRPRWSFLLAATRGVPQRQWSHEGTLGDIAVATADFRDQYYGLADAVSDDLEADRPRLITVGLIDPAHNRWGELATRFNGSTYRHPRIDLERLDPDMRRWASQRLVPKVLVGTQTKTIEAIVDLRGELLPSVPVISVWDRDWVAGSDLRDATGMVDDDSSLWRIAALLSSPPVSAIAVQRHIGSGLAVDAVRLTARDLLMLPLPADRDAWEEAGDIFVEASRSEPTQRRHLLRRVGEQMCAAFGQPGDTELVDWWQARLPARS